MARNFLKGFDGYSKTVTLKYKKKGAFQTSCGGLASIITFAFFVSWIVIEVVDVYVRGKFEMTESTVLTQSLTPGLIFPIYSID